MNIKNVKLVNQEKYPWNEDLNSIFFFNLLQKWSADLKTFKDENLTGLHLKFQLVPHSKISPSRS